MPVLRNHLFWYGRLLILLFVFLVAFSGHVFAASGKGIPASAITNTANYSLKSKNEIVASYPGIGNISFTGSKADVAFRPPADTFCIPDQGRYIGTVPSDIKLGDGTTIYKGNTFNAGNMNLINVVSDKTDVNGYTIYGYVAAYLGTNDQNCGIDVSNPSNVSLAIAPITLTLVTAASVFTDKTIPEISATNFTFKDGANIVLSFKNTTVTFRDDNPEDRKREFLPTDNSAFCGGGAKITFEDAQQSDKSLLVNVLIPWYDTSASSNGACKSGKDSKLITPTIDNSKDPAPAMTVLTWGDGAIIKSVSSVSKLNLAKLSGESTGKIYISGAGCAAYVVELASAGGNSGTIYNLEDAAGDRIADPKTDIGKNFPLCHVKYQRAVAISGTYIDPGGGGGGGVTGSDAACYTWEWSWAVCPVINAAQTTADAMYRFVEDQLKFTVSDSNKTTDSLGAEHDNVKSAWNNFRILVSGLVVILLLIMIISQAIGSGPFDAYTIKKMLPRLVIGVIVIQISWPMFSWVVNAVDHLGRGLADLMYAPFGGASSMTLDKVLAPFGAGNLVFNWVGLGAMAVFGVVAPFIVLGMILTVLVAIFVGFLTLLFRKIIIILALIFVPVALISWMMPNEGLRKYWKLWWDNFIKALMMFPLIVAMIAAGRIFAKIGSGQSDFVGFFIVLVGFFGPLFILPKAFKWGGTLMQTAGQGIASAGQKGLKKPKEFLGERQKGYSEERTRQSRERYLRGEGVGFNRNWQRGFGVPSLWRRPIDLIKAGQVDPTLWGRRKETAMRKYRASGAESEEADIKAADQEFGLLASQSDNHDVFARQVGGARIGDEITWTDKEAAARGEQDNRRLRVTADMKRAGMNGMTKFGTDRTFRELSRVIDELHHGNADEQILAERFLDANVGTLKPKMDYLYRGQSRVPGGSDAIPDWVLNPDTGAMELRGPVEARVGSLTPEAFASMEAPELEALLAGLSQVANHHADAAARAAAEDRLRTIYTHYEGALNNDQIRRAVGSSLNQAMKAHLDGTGIAGINTVRGQAGLTTDIEQVPTIMTPAVAAIAARIRADGTAT